MNCPVCDRSLAPTLSICPSCGAMMFDSVREELQTKITSGRLPRTTETKPEIEFRSEVAKPAIAAPSASVAPAPTVQTVQSAPAVASSAAAVASPAVAPRLRPARTADLVAPKTSPTLVGFQSSNATLPDWRIKLQNAVQQRKGSSSPDTVVNGTIMPAPAIERPKPVLEARPVAQAAPAKKFADPRVESALRRINESRSTFLEKPQAPPVKQAPIAAKPYKFDVVAKAPAAAPSVPRPKPVSPPLQVVATPPISRDTNKLPPLSVRSIPVSEPADDLQQMSVHSTSPAEFSAINRIRIKAEADEIEQFDAPVTAESDDIEDLAHFSSRFGSAFFDLIITSFASVLVLVPIAIARSGEWFSLGGLLTFAGVCAIITFFYMTICLGFYGKTMGMRLFSLELVDAVENEYPTLHQAAVSSSVFLLSLIFGGAGFITMLFNEEKRAAHDLLSGTILVREF